MFDRSFFDRQCDAFGNDRIARYLSLLIEELAQRTSAIDTAERRGDRAGLAEHAHAVASVAGNLGFGMLVTIGRRLELGFAAMPDDEIAPALDEFREAIAATTTIAHTLREELASAVLEPGATSPTR